MMALCDHPLEIYIVSVEKLKLNFIIEPIQKCIRFLLIGVAIIRWVSWQLSKSFEIFIHNHTVWL
jgi:hypothetical protein